MLLTTSHNSGLGMLGTLGSLGASTAFGLPDHAARDAAEDQKFRECGVYATPWYCGTPLQYLNSRCAEHADLVGRCLEGSYMQPPMPPAPRPPSGALEPGGVTDPGAVDEVVNTSYNDYVRAMTEFFSRQADRNPPDNEHTLAWWAIPAALAGLLLLVVIAKR